MAVLAVGTGQEYSTIASAIAAAGDGDVIQVQAGTYTNDFAEITHKITLEAVGGPVNMVATEPIPNGKAILVTDTDVTINGFTFSGATVTDANGAGIRYQGGNLVIENSVFENNQNGILAGVVPGGTIDIENSEFINNGSGTGYTHGIYIGDIAKLTVNNSYFTGTNVGHEIKSRAETNVITNSRIQDGPNGTASYTIDLPNGGNDTITNDVIEKGPNSENPVMISFGEEGGIYANSQLTVSNDTLLYDHSSSSSSVFVRNSTSAQATVSNNEYHGPSAAHVLSGTGTVSNDTALSTEPALNTSSPVDTDPSDSTAAGSGGSSGATGSMPPSSVTTPVSLGTNGSNTLQPVNLPNGELPVYRFFDSVTGTQFLTDSTAEADQILATRPDLASEGLAFAAANPSDPGAASIYRFFDTSNGTHFFTESATERDSVIATRPDMTYEGVAFDDYTTQQPGTVPVYRFFETTNGTHLFTDSASERASILATRPDLTPEGIAFYAPSTS